MINTMTEILFTWCDALIKCQLKDTGNPAFDGGILCPACKIMHGRCDNAILPFMYLYKMTGDRKYYEAATSLFKWHEWQCRIIKQAKETECRWGTFK
jgi:hypothetical protein